MHIFPAIILISSASAVAATSMGQHLAKKALMGLFERQDQICQPVPPPLTCEKSCGPGYVTCVDLPTCYNPSLGETCCSDGTYCPAGNYCTDAGCCPNGNSLADCGATVTLATVSPPASTSPPSTSPTSTSSPTTTSSSPSSKPPVTNSTTTHSLNSTTSAPLSVFTGAANMRALGGFALPLALVGAIVAF